MVLNYGVLQPLSIMKPHHSPSTWIAPPPGSYKINVDAALQDGDVAGIGIAIRDHEGILAAAPSSVCEGDAAAAAMGLHFAVKTCFKDVILEGDNISVWEKWITPPTHHKQGRGAATKWRVGGVIHFSHTTGEMVMRI
ncbi:hypothetical protein PIB30_053480 [Stylosanthes scabra]|uniref:RNase H type-1 domain-containing protein n=1 Tax=Stylosanthes scabra TaxID=79078 RepID=A0ABU6XG98_9FABA|nr:hypothetical protein [Stylosanthes scabra]